MKKLKEKKHKMACMRTPYTIVSLPIKPHALLIPSFAFQALDSTDLIAFEGGTQ